MGSSSWGYARLDTRGKSPGMGGVHEARVWFHLLIGIPVPSQVLLGLLQLLHLAGSEEHLQHPH